LIAAQKEDRRLRWHTGEDLTVAAGLELKPVEEHSQILDGIPGGCCQLSAISYQLRAVSQIAIKNGAAGVLARRTGETPVPP
jgi:hypothetical protein